MIATENESKVAARWGITPLQLAALRWAADGKTGLGNASAKRGLRVKNLLADDGSITPLGRAALIFIGKAEREG